MTITNAGNVGIGTTSPVGRLDIMGGDAYFREQGIATVGNQNYDSQRLYFRGSAWVGGAAVNQEASIYLDAYQQANGQALVLRHGNTSERLGHRWCNSCRLDLRQYLQPDYRWRKTSPVQ
jgi:hypothetical protein